MNRWRLAAFPVVLTWCLSSPVVLAEAPAPHAKERTRADPARSGTSRGTSDQRRQTQQAERDAIAAEAVYRGMMEDLGLIAADGTPKLLRDGSDNPAYSHPPKGYLSPEGFEKVRWGMSEAEVRKHYPQVGTVEQGLGFEGGAAMSRKSTVIFAFAGQRLAMVHVAFWNSGLKRELFFKEYEAVKASLMMQYGKPDKDKVSWGNRDMFGDSPDMSLAVGQGQASLQTVWLTRESQIHLECAPTGKFLRPEITLTSLSLRLSKALNQELNPDPPGLKEPSTP